LHRDYGQLRADIVDAFQHLVGGGKKAATGSDVQIDLVGQEEVKHELILLGDGDVHDCLAVELVGQADLVDELWEARDHALG